MWKRRNNTKIRRTKWWWMGEEGGFDTKFTDIWAQANEILGK